MSASFESIICSRLFKFLIGPDEFPVMVYEEALALQSPALAAMMRNGMLESNVGEAGLEDVDKGTFLRFVQFIYSGDYSISQSSAMSVNYQPEPIVEESIVEENTIEELQNDWRASITPEPPVIRSRRVKKVSNGFFIPKPVDNFNSTFGSLTYPIPNSQSVFATLWAHQNSSGFEQKDLMEHAVLYGLADKWGLEDLKTLTLHKLHKTLSRFALRSHVFSHVIHLARWAYSNENIADVDGGIDPLRHLISQYIAAATSLTSESAEFAALLEEGGPFVSDLWKEVAHRKYT